MNGLEEAIYRLIEAIERQTGEILPPWDEWPGNRAKRLVEDALERGEEV